jgi:predicted nucleic acid-binding Zn ribbon protein
MENNFCVICGRVIPEGRMTCPICEKKIMEETIKRTGKNPFESGKKRKKKVCLKITDVELQNGSRV